MARTLKGCQVPLLEGRLQRDMVVALDARWPGIERQASMNGATLKGGARAWSRHHSEGALQGDPDLNVREGGRNGERGLFVEVKLEGRALSPLQRWRFARLKARNYACVVAHSVEDLLTTVLNYLPPDFTAVPDPVNDPRSLPRRTRTRTRAPRPQRHARGARPERAAALRRLDDSPPRQCIRADRSARQTAVMTLAIQKAPAKQTVLCSPETMQTAAGVTLPWLWMMTTPRTIVAATALAARMGITTSRRAQRAAVGTGSVLTAGVKRKATATAWPLAPRPLP